MMYTHRHTEDMKALLRRGIRSVGGEGPRKGNGVSRVKIQVMAEVVFWALHVCMKRGGAGLGSSLPF